MAFTPNFLLGKHLTALTVAPITEAADGTITVQSSSSLLGYVDGVRFSSDPQLEMIQSLGRYGANYENLLEDSSISIVEILRRSQGGIFPLLPVVAASYDAAQFVLTRGGKTYTYQGRRSSFRDGVENFGKNTCELTLRPIDIGTGTGISVAYS